jgi:hypothetical protein
MNARIELDGRKLTDFTSDFSQRGQVQLGHGSGSTKENVSRAWASDSPPVASSTKRSMDTHFTQFRHGCRSSRYFFLTG